MLEKLKKSGCQVIACAHDVTCQRKVFRYSDGTDAGLYESSSESPSDWRKYLGLMLDRGLTWKPNIEERIRKATLSPKVTFSFAGRWTEELLEFKFPDHCSVSKRREPQLKKQ